LILVNFRAGPACYTAAKFSSRRGDSRRKERLRMTTLRILAAALFFVIPVVHAQDDGAATLVSRIARDSRAVQLGDTELDRITAGTLSLNFVANPGAADILKPGQHAVCVNCAGASSHGAQVLIFVENPAQTFLKCVHLVC
jgi:hypothetical protein